MKNLLHTFSELRDAGFLEPIDVEWCRFLQQVEPGINQEVLLAACLTSVAYRAGNVCIVIDDYAGQAVFEEAPQAFQLKAPSVDEWLQVLRKSTVVGGAGNFKPLILDEGNRLYLHKLWSYEKNLAALLLDRAGKINTSVNKEILADGLERLFNEESTEKKVNWQKTATAIAVYNKLTLISGGPGTGKTTIVARILALLLEQHPGEKSLDIALAAPTGKAAARLQESILNAKAGLEVSKETREAIPAEAVTIHQLLGARRHTSQLRYNSDNPLPYDVVIIDEASMIDQALMNKVMNALLDKTQLILLGDKDQLASVEAGAVMGDIYGAQKANNLSSEMAARLKELSVFIPARCISSDPAALIDNIILLEKSYRFSADSGIGRLAAGINTGNAPEALQVINDSSFPDVKLVPIDSHRQYIDTITGQVMEHFQLVQQAASTEEMFRLYRRFQILAAHRKGPRGVTYLNRQIEKALQKEGMISRYEPWYAGKPVIINRNNYSLGLSNGDLGVCMQDSDGTVKIFFNIDDTLTGILPSRLPDHSTGFALTVHKSQGSEFDHIFLVLPDQLSRILSRELLYTAVTRARKSVTIVGNEEVIKGAINRNIARSSGLKDYLWNANGYTVLNK